LDGNIAGEDNVGAVGGAKASKGRRNRTWRRRTPGASGRRRGAPRRPRKTRPPRPKRSRSHEKLSDDVDSILDEIDEVLEENAEEFVRSYVQKGGE
jgi:ubiquitin-like protein Pup